MPASWTFFAAALVLAAGPWHSAALVANPAIPPRKERALQVHVNHLRQHVAPSLEREVSRMEQEAQASLGVEKERLEALLRAQRAQNKMAASKNERILKSLVGLQADCSSLRAEGERVLEDCELLAGDIEAIQKNSSVAGDFLDNVLNQTDFALWQAPEVKVLADLDARDDAENKEKVVQHAIANMRRDAKHQAPRMKRPALLQLPDVQDTLSSLLTSVQDFQRKQNSSFTELHATFEKQMQALHDVYKSTIEEQGRLNVTRAQTRERKAKLTEAVAHLREARGILFDRSKNVRRFAKKVGDAVPAWQPLAMENPERERLGTKGWSVLSKLLGKGSAQVRAFIDPFTH